MNKELVSLLVQLGLGCLAIMAVIAVACLVTPKIAKLIEKKYPPERVEENETTQQDGEYTVQGPFEPSKLEDYDLNYKIYNKDIYGVDFKNGKKQKRKDG